MRIKLKNSAAILLFLGFGESFLPLSKHIAVHVEDCLACTITMPFYQTPVNASFSSANP
ncbi:hypothetical protein CIPAW_08G137400 [Carya illinoinensis]|uniref:Uncharacterized protein n=1 Tax=Carya illinoinensis TaxID=32201 RepID=A0A8T1PTT1_CARIL|nr:hypothetical protein CIPAW_08G137400 [Carya illinoinensis]